MELGCVERDPLRGCPASPLARGDIRSGRVWCRVWPSPQVPAWGLQALNRRLEVVDAKEYRPESEVVCEVLAVYLTGKVS